MVAMQVVAMLTHPFFGSCDVCAYVWGSQLEQDPQHVTIFGSGKHTHSSLIPLPLPPTHMCTGVGTSLYCSHVCLKSLLSARRISTELGSTLRCYISMMRCVCEHMCV